MHRVVFKQSIPIRIDFSLSIALSAKINCIQTINGFPYIYFETDPDAKEIKRFFKTFETGEFFPDLKLQYIGSYQIENGKFMYHVYEHID